MRNKIFAVLILALFTGLAAAQTTTIKGTVKDREGKPIDSAKVQFKNLDDGTHYELKTNKKGEYFSLGIKPGSYDITLVNKEGQQIYKLNKVPVTMDENRNIFDIDLQKELGAMKPAAPANAPAGQSSSGGVSTDDAEQNIPTGQTQGANAATQTPAAQSSNEPIVLTEEQQKKLTPEQKKQYEEYQKSLNENNRIKGLNSILAQALNASKTGNLDESIRLVQGTTQQDPNRALLWAILGDYQVQSARKITDSAARKERYAEAVASFQKAVQLGQTATDEQSKAQLPQWKLGLGNAADGAAKYDDAIAAFSALEQDAATTNPKMAGLAAYDHGLVLTKTGKIDEAVAQFDKAVQLDPAMTEAYYQKGTALIAKATADKAGKIIAPPGTAEAFQKYLELSPNGKNAESAAAQLEFLGQKVQKSFKKQ
jgi:tetratricopeptide (TPR) repeat protein